MGRNIVLCLDGTNNQVTSGITNVSRMYSLLEHGNPETQLTYYDAGLGTFSLAGAWTPWAKWFTRAAGMAFGLGLRENVAEAYTFLVRNWRPGDRIFVFGFSRGAYSAAVLISLLRLVGVLRPGAENLVPYVSELVLRGVRTERSWNWAGWHEFSNLFAQSEHGYSTVRVELAGLWDTVNAVGFLRRHRMPYSRTLPNVVQVRHAVSIDERRLPYRPQLVEPLDDDDAVEVWFAGEHSDIGGCFSDRDDSQLGDLSFLWMLRQARAAGVQLNHYGQKTDEWGEPEQAQAGEIHRAAWYWGLLGFRRRRIPEHARVHESVRRRIELDATYRPELPESVVWDDGTSLRGRPSESAP